MKLAGKVVVITGAASGLGKALAYEFTKHKSVIVAVDRDKVGLASIQNELPDVVTIIADVTEQTDLHRVLDDTINIHSQLDIWINNAGVLGADGPALDQDIESIRDVFAVNTLGLIGGTQVAGKYFAKHPGGWIINVLSSTALQIVPNRSVYAASKHASHEFTQALKQELQHTNVMAVYPEGIQTNLFGDRDEPNYDDFMTCEHVAAKIVAAVIADSHKDLVIKR